MAYLDALAHDIVGLLRTNRGWMSWNLILAVIPAALAVVLFPRTRPRTRGWWAGVVAFVALLPNAPYVVTDLIHLHPDFERNPSLGLLVTGLLPLYATFIAIGYVAYVVAIDRVVLEVQAIRPRTPRWIVELPIHLACSVGIVLGRVARLNSWDTITRPTSTVEQAFATLSFSRAPYWVVAVLVAVVLTATAVRLAIIGAGRIGGHASTWLSAART